MKFLRIKVVYLATAAAVLALLFTVATVLGWSNTRFTRISVCTSCHEIFVDHDEYKPVTQESELSGSVEDFKPTEVFDPGLFNVTVGCAECHAYPFEEYRESPHYDNDTGVRPGCLGCHDPHSVRQILAWKFFYVNDGGMGESPFHAIANSIRDVSEWEGLRKTLALRVREQMIEEDSAKCKVCHKVDSEWFNGIKRHQVMLKEGDKTCIHCHYNLVHEDVPWDKTVEK